MRLTFDSQAQAAYVYTDVEDKKVVHTVQPPPMDSFPGIYAIDFNAKREVVGYEFLGVTEFEQLDGERG